MHTDNSAGTVGGEDIRGPNGTGKIQFKNSETLSVNNKTVNFYHNKFPINSIVNILLILGSSSISSM